MTSAQTCANCGQPSHGLYCSRMCALDSQDQHAARRTDVSSVPGQAVLNPLVSVKGWVLDLTLYGVGFGAVASFSKFDEVSGGVGMLWLTVFNSAGAGAFLGALSGLTTGLSLKALRGRLPPALGLLLGVLASISPYVLILLSVDKSDKLWSISPIWALVIMVLIPLIAVRRSKGLPVTKWCIGLGMLAAGGIHVVRFFVA